jgi:5-methylthioadenosine/S-adenosylhomocysteine deaminase
MLNRDRPVPASSESDARNLTPALLAGGSILDVSSSAIRAADILIEDGVIAHVAPRGTIIQPAARHLDAAGCVVVPGLTNAHTHSPENLASGYCDALTLDDWLKVIWGPLDALPPHGIALAVKMGAAQMLKCGVTAVVDHFRQTPMSWQAVESARDAYESTGMRALVAVMLRDRVAPDGRLVGVATPMQPMSLAEARDLWTEVAKNNNPESRVNLALGPSGATRCSDGMLELAVEIAQHYSLCLHTHVAETQSCAQCALELYGRRTLRHLNDIGFLGPRTSLAHCVWIDDDEIELIARSGSVAVHNPISNMVLGAGVAPVPAMLAAGVHVAVGTDGAASNGGQNILESAKCAALLARCGTADARNWLTAQQAMTAVVHGGRRIFSLGASAIGAGDVADIAVFPLTKNVLDNFFDPVRSLVYGVQSGARHVLVAGEPVVVDEEICSFDESALQTEFQQFREERVLSH